MYYVFFLLFISQFLLDFGRIPSGQAIHLYLFLPFKIPCIFKLLGKKRIPLLSLALAQIHTPRLCECSEAI